MVSGVFTDSIFATSSPNMPYPPTPSRFPPQTTMNCSFSMDLPTLDISYKRNYTVCGLLCLASFKTFLSVAEYQYFAPFMAE